MTGDDFFFQIKVIRNLAQLKNLPFSGKKLRDGKCLGGRGRLTILKCNAVQNFYGRAIRDNKNDPEAMSNATWAILKHYASTEQRPMHENCPTGPNSWCSYQRDCFTGQKTHVPTKHPFTGAMLQAMIPTFSKLADKHFLEGVKKCSTQNPNESLNHVIWSIAPKEQFVSSQETSLAISLGVCIFNDGLYYTLTKMFALCGLSPSSSSEMVWKCIDKQRVKNGNYKMTIACKEKRKQRKRLQCKQQDAFQHAEGVQYKSNAFHVDSTSKKGKKTKNGKKTKS